MTQQHISRLLDIPDRTLRDWKKTRYRLYELLESLDYHEVKSNINAVDIDDVVEFNPNHFSHNLFWQTNKPSYQKVYAIISKYLSTLNKDDIQMLCFKYGKNIVKSVLRDKYKKMYKKGFISTSGIDIDLNGSYTQNETYKKLLGMINDC